MAEEAEKPIRFGNHVIELLKKIRNIPNSAKEVFLWDLIRIATGDLFQYRMKCLDKQRNNNTKDSDFVIKIEADKVYNTLSISHLGIGFSKDDLKDEIGCISEDIVNKIHDSIDKYLMNGDPDAYYSAAPSYGFCLGFYSAFMVADRVVITTTTKPEKEAAASKVFRYRKPRDQYVWDASATDGFFVVARDLNGYQLTRGTKVTLYLKNEYLTYLDESKLRQLADKYTLDCSCLYPIYVSADHERDKKRKRTAGEKDLRSLKDDFERLRKVCVDALGSRVKKVVVSDRVFDLPSHLSDDSKRFFINPRSPIMISLLKKFNENPDAERENVMDTFILHYNLFALTRKETYTCNFLPGQVH